MVNYYEFPEKFPRWHELIDSIKLSQLADVVIANILQDLQKQANKRFEIAGQRETLRIIAEMECIELEQ